MSTARENGRQALTMWLAAHEHDSGETPTVLRKAVDLVADRNGDLPAGNGFISPAHYRAVVEILQDLKADTNTQAAALVYLRCLEAGTLPSVWREALGPSVCGLVDELLQVADVKDMRQRADAEGLRRLLLAIVRDLRVVLVILADQLARSRAMAKAPAVLREEIARDNQAIYAPLANRLGIWQLKWELEDLAFRYLNPETYKRIARLLDERRADREKGIAQVVKTLQESLGKAGIEAEVAGRPKHIFSIWNKMQRKGVGFQELFDVRAVRILVNDIAQCYAALGLVHSLWQHIPGEFDDYIATPKANQYRSLHTAVIGPGGKPLEVQIRTIEMHEESELGVAAHWRYKEGGARDAAYERKLAWMRRLLSRRGDEELLEEFRADVGEDRVYVLTPKGKVLDLSVGATVLDFAYHIHTDVGHRCRGAKVNGRIVPLTHRLANGEQVEILSAKTGGPSRDWMVPALGYLATGRARQKVRQWFRKVDFERNRDEGRAQVEKELTRLGIRGAPLDEVVARFNFTQTDDLFAAVGAGEITPTQVVNAVDAQLGPKLAPRLPVTAKAVRGKSAQDAVTIEGVGNLLYQLARCCKPVPQDDIVGYITKGSGVSIHRRDCRNVLRARHEQSPRLIEVEWGGPGQAVYSVDVQLKAFDRKGLVHDISGVLTNTKARVESFASQVDGGSGQADIRIVVQVEDVEQLSALLSRLAALPNVTEVKRVGTR